MRKKTIFIFLVVCMLLVGCNRKEDNFIQAENTVDVEEHDLNTPLMVFVDDKIYYSTGKRSEVDGRCGVMDGEITSTVSKDEIPTQNNQSNFGIGFGWQRGATNTIEIYFNGDWWVFEAKDFKEKETHNAGGSWKVSLTNEDKEFIVPADISSIISDYISSCKYELGTANCLNDFCFIKEGGDIIYYHSECGTFNDYDNDTSYKLAEGQKDWVNNYLLTDVVEAWNKGLEICEGVPLKD